METKHTPGPWGVESDPMGDNDYATEIVIPGFAGQWGTSVATCHHNWQEAVSGERRISWNEAQANARLIAAAPELFEYVQSSAMNGCATAQALIAKATGQ